MQGAGANAAGPRAALRAHLAAVRSAIAARLEGFIPAEFKRDHPADVQRARLAMSVAWLLVVAVTLLAVTRAAVGNSGEAALGAAFVAALVAAAFHFRRTGRLQLAVNGVLFLACASGTAGSILVRGAGVTSATIGLAVIPLVATLLGGVRTGAVWAVVCSLAGAVIGWLGHLGLIADRLDARAFLFNEHSALFITTAGLYLVAALYETQKEQMLREVATLGEERGEAERKAVRARAAAERARAERLMSMGRLAGGVAHEINNPLAYVLSNLELVTEQLRGRPGGEGPDEVLEMLAEARTGVEQIRRIVRDLRSFSRAGEERRVLVDLREVLAPAINMTHNEIKHRARLVKDYARVPLVECDEGRLGQVFINLLMNAAQSIPEGHADDNEIRVVTTTGAAGEAIVEVRDTGSGIAPENIDRIFDPFFTTKDVGVGTGLGLSICHGIVTALGGQLGVESEPGNTVFRVTLSPASRQAPAEPRAEPLAAPAQGRRGRVLVVDDDPLGVRVLARVLGKDHDVTAHRDPRQALEAIAGGERFDVILCDLMMPEMTGMELCEKVRALAPAQAKRMVFVTGGAFTPEAKDFLDRAPNQRIDKPFNTASLRGIVQRMVEGKER